MSNPHSTQFIADGQRQLKATPEYRQQVAEIRQRVWAQYQAEFAHATFVRRSILRWRIWREIRTACADLAPTRALYLR